MDATTTDFTSNFWSLYVTVITVVGIVACFWLLISQSKSTQKKGKNQDNEMMEHVWDGDLQEYNNPLPRWWLIMFVLSLIFSCVYLYLYPGLGSYKGNSNTVTGIETGDKKVVAWSSTGQYKEEMAQANEKYKSMYEKYTQTDVKTLAQDPAAMTTARNLYNTYCMQCHATDARGSRGFPNLTDKDWLWGGEPEQIMESIQYGRTGIMEPWGERLGTAKVEDVANYVLSLSGKLKADNPVNTASIARGKEVFNSPPAMCVTCHMADGKGNSEAGYPNLTDDIWLWNGSKQAIVNTINNGHNNVMPIWYGFLDENKMHLLTAYVWGLSNNDASAKPDNQ